MNKKPLVAISVIALIALGLTAGSAAAQDPAPLAVAPEMLAPQSPHQPEAPAGTQLDMRFSYQGQLQKGGSPHNGNCNFQFSLWDAASGGVQKGTTLTKTGLTVANGLFSTELDFGFQFEGEMRWLQTSVQCAGDANYLVLNPRQPQNGVPYALGLRPGAVIKATNGYGLDGRSVESVGVHGSSTNFFGTVGTSVNFPGGWFVSEKHDGLQGISKDSGRSGVAGLNEANGNGVFGFSKTGHGISASSNGAGIPGAALYASAPSGNGIAIYADNGASPDSTMVLSNSGTGAFIIGLNGGQYKFVVASDGSVTGKQLTITGGSDLAERFEQASGAKAEPGTVMVADEDNIGKLMVSDAAYDSKVIGIVSGAGGINTGLTLHQEGALAGDVVVAVAGRVYAKCEATSSPIKPGDLLTTSRIPGHCMKATDRERRDGAVIGKAMSALKTGKGLVLVVVNLQ
jgi:hypothetical protein